MYLHRLIIRDLRCFQRADGSFVYPGRAESDSVLVPRPGFENVNLILGDNGSGKTTALKAIALAVLGGVLPGQGFRAYSLIRTGAQENAEIDADLALLGEELQIPTSQGGNETYRIGVERRGPEEILHGFMRRAADGRHRIFDPDQRWYDGGPQYFLCGYGASRRAESSETYDEGARLKARGLRYQRVASLFEESYSLTSFSAWLLHASDGRNKKSNLHWDSICRILHELPKDDSVLWDRSHVDGQAMFTDQRLARVHFDALSDGYRAFLAWVGDLLKNLCEVTPAGTDLAATPGIVLVDEIDLHLHPKWQRTVLRTIAATFPKLQFIVTSHSPILVGCLPPENIQVADCDADGFAYLRRASENLYGHEVDEILTSAEFGLESTLPPDLERLRAEKLQERMSLGRRLLADYTPENADAYLKMVKESP